METIARKPLQGVTNIVKFNWHFYVLAALVITALVLLRPILPANLGTLCNITSILILFATLFSLSVSCYVYDYSGLYDLKWLDLLNIQPASQIVNINAGFDETSALILQKYPLINLIVFDFYDPTKHTEISIERARSAYPPFAGTVTIETNKTPLSPNSVDAIFLILAAHEIRSKDEKTIFFQQLNTALLQQGKIIVIEHSRDLPNFIAYNIGFFHFFSKKHWRSVYSSSGLLIEKEFKITPFITGYILKKNGTTS